ncbi:AraC family transcriptional regulator [Fluviicola sp.]|uniref:helix-turn-helix domain-containing protein n=1 Tax=Fluviicola sp. TaxID=1917219 RepID=UPI0031E3D3FC
MDDSHMHYVGKEISPEQFVAEHTLAYILKGVMNIYDGTKQVSLYSGDCCIARKNRLARYNKERINNELEKVFVFFDKDFLKRFQEKYGFSKTGFPSAESLIPVESGQLLDTFMQSLLPYYHRGKIEEPFADLKREELLLILLRKQPDLAGLFFDYGIPEKIDIEAFMNQNFRFNVSISRFAFLTGRSISAFKRDFKEIFNDTPNHWLKQKRLEEANFLLSKKGRKPSEIYLELGFEDLTHFSYAFKKHFGETPSEVSRRREGE